MQRIRIIGMIAIVMTLGACESPVDLPPGDDRPGTDKPGSGPPPAQSPHTVIFGGYEAPLLAGDTARLSVRALNAAGVELSLPVVWSSADTALATVTADGLMTARAAGMARINALVGSYPASVLIPVRNRAAVLDDVSPRSATVGSGAVMITVTGRNFVEGAWIAFGGEVLPTLRISGTELRAEIPAKHLESVGVVPVAVRNPNSQAPSDTASFTIERHTPVTATFHLVGVNGEETLPVQLDRFRYRDFHTGAEYDEVIRSITAGRLVLESPPGEDTQFIAYYTETLTDAATGHVVKQSNLLWSGYIEYDMMDGSILFVSAGLPFTIRGWYDGADAIVMDQSLGGSKRHWRYVRK